MTKAVRVAFFGLGIMGLPMATRLVRAGFDVSGYDPNADQASRLKAVGGRGSAVPPFRVDGPVDAVVTMLPSAKVVREVLVEGVIPFAKTPVLFIDCSTIDVSTTTELAREATAHGHAFVDAPVSGGFEMATAGELSFMVGGEHSAVQRARPLFDAMGSRVEHFGPASSGQAVKACNNMVVGISMLALCEGFALVEKMGLNQRQVLDLWMNAGVRSWLLENRCPVPGLLPNVPSSNSYKPGFASTMMVKDLDFAQQASLQHEMATPLGALAFQRYKDFVAAGGGDLDFSAIYKLYVTK